MISVVIPVFNEEEVLEALYERFLPVLDRLAGGPHELCFVNDGSSDRSLELLLKLRHERHRIRVVSLSRNFGHQAALIAGLKEASGELIAIFDADLQDPPEALERMVAQQQEGYDVVFVRRATRTEGLLLQLCYTLAYRIVNFVADRPLPLDAGDCCLMTRRVATLLATAPERCGYLRGLRSWLGFRQIGIDVHRAPRFAGASKYSWRALLRLMFNGVFSFSSAPLRAGILIGASGIALCFLYVFFALGSYLFGAGVPRGFTALLLVIVALSSVQFLLLGLMGEYIGRMYDELKGRPPFVIESRYVDGVKHDGS